jgi:ATP-dependent RNA/DNA helicase IGHMBP2
MVHKGVSVIKPPHVATPDEYFDRLLRWLALESDAERARLAQRRALGGGQDAERTGETLVDLVLADHRIGLGGRYLLSYRKRRVDAMLPWNRLKVGSPVIVSSAEDADDEGVAGVVSRRTTHQIEVALDVWPEGDRFRIDLSPDETTRRRQRAAIAQARQLRGAPMRLRERLLGYEPPRFDSPAVVKFFGALNPPQADAVRFALSAKDFAIIHGPPGTGKTTTLAEVIYQAVKAGDRVLACASSNTAVDNLLERLIQTTPGVVRVGHPARVFESLREHTLDEQVGLHPSSRIASDLMRQAESLVRQAAKPSRSADGRRRAGQLRAEARNLQNQARSLERQAIRYVLDSASVICTTTTIDDDLLGDREFDTVVIDEAGQSTEASVWQAVLRAGRVILAGDHFQLPPTVLSDIATREGMRESLMQRLIDRFGMDVYRRLTVQYRMNEAIMRFSSKQFYDGSLVADASVRNHKLCDLRGVALSDCTTIPAMFIDTAGAGYEEELEPDGLSKRNPKEANIVVSLVRKLTSEGLSGDQIAIIAPYAAQVRLLRSRLNLQGLEVDTVDGFQGREKEAVIVTLVRSNERGEIGFLADTRRTNVALTRARRCLIVVGDSATLGADQFYGSMLEYFESIGGYRTVWDESVWQHEPESQNQSKHSN